MRAAALLALAALAGCGGGARQAAGPTFVTVTVTGSGGRHTFHAEVAATAAAQERGLMYRTDLRPDDAMLFWPYPPAGAPKVANFWMKNTPTPLDIVFIRADGTIARIAENAVPMSEAIVSSNEPVAAVLEVVGGRTADTGVSEGDRVSWPGRY